MENRQKKHRKRVSITGRYIQVNITGEHSRETTEKDNSYVSGSRLETQEATTGLNDRQNIRCRQQIMDVTGGESEQDRRKHEIKPDIDHDSWKTEI